MAEIVSIAFRPDRGLPRPLHERASLRAGHGIVGDHKAGKSQERALNIIDLDRLEELQRAGYEVRPGSLGENLVVRGAALDRQPAGTLVRLGEEAVVRIVKPRTGCDNLSYIHSDFPAVSEGRVGVLCSIEAGGEIRVGDPVVVLEAVPAEG
jgi:MOSC domain-containing protein YiiM